MKAARVSFSALLVLLVATLAVAQERFQDRLPANTLAYLASSGSQSLDSVRSTNPLLRLLASPEMKANWEALRARQQLQTDAQARDSAAVQQEDLLEVLTAAGLVALLPPDPEAPPRAPGGPQPVLLFLLDMQGQEAIVERLRGRVIGQGGSFSSYELDGIRVEEARNRDGSPTGYLARLDRWLAGGSEKAATENWIRAVREAPAGSLGETDGYGRVRAIAGETGQWEAYANLPALVDLFAAVPSLHPSAPPPELVTAALGLRAFGPLLARVDFRADTTWYEIVLARRESAASPLDALAPVATQFHSLSLGGPDAIGYSVTRVDFQAAWSFLSGAASALFPPVLVFVEMANTFLQEKSGFTLPQHIAAWGDEVAHFEYAGKDNKQLETVWALRHRDPARVQALIEGTLPPLAQRLGFREPVRVGGQAESPAHYRLERKTGSEAGTPGGELNAIYLAATEEWLLLSGSESALQRTLARAPASPSLAETEIFRRARGRFPADLSSFGFMNVDAWLASGVLERWFGMAAAAQGTQVSGKDSASNAPAEPPPPPAKLNIPGGYLKWIVTATTQDTRGIYHSGYIE